MQINYESLIISPCQVFLYRSISICDIVIYNKKYIFGLCPVSGTELLKPLEFSK